MVYSIQVTLVAMVVVVVVIEGLRMSSGLRIC